jgi:hypothetical protein
MIKHIFYLAIFLLNEYSNVSDLPTTLSLYSDGAKPLKVEAMSNAGYISGTNNIQANVDNKNSIGSESNSISSERDSISVISMNSLHIDSLSNDKMKIDTMILDSVDILGLPDSLKTQLHDSTLLMDEIALKSDSLIFPEVENNAFKIGEKLSFKIRYGFIRAGNATMSVKAEKKINNRPVYYIQTTAKSASGFNWIYKVEDIVTSYMDKEGLFSWKFEKRLREGGYKADLFVDYDPFQALANVSFIRYHKNMKIRKKENYEVKTPPFVLDILAAFYYVRTQKLQVGKSIFLTNHEKKKVNNLEIKVYKRERIKVDAGEFDCLVVEPLLFGEGIFKQKGTLKVWLTDDQYKIPVQMKSAVLVGNITTELEKIEGIAQPLPAQKR